MNATHQILANWYEIHNRASNIKLRYKFYWLQTCAWQKFLRRLILILFNTCNAGLMFLFLTLVITVYYIRIFKVETAWYFSELSLFSFIFLRVLKVETLVTTQHLLQLDFWVSYNTFTSVLFTTTLTTSTCFLKNKAIWICN